MPREFRYFERIDEPWARALRASTRALLGFDLALPDEVLPTFAPDAGLPLGARVRAWLSHGVHLGYTRFFLPPPIHSANGLPGAGFFALYPLACFPFVFTAETLRRWIPPFDEVADRDPDPRPDHEARAPREAPRDPPRGRRSRRSHPRGPAAARGPLGADRHLGRERHRSRASFEAIELAIGRLDLPRAP